MKTSLEILKYIEECPPDRQAYLQELYCFLAELLPEAEQKISWQMPTFRQRVNIIHFANFKKHVGIFPGSEVIAAMQDELKGYAAGKGTLHLNPSEPIPRELLRKVVEYNLSHLVK